MAFKTFADPPKRNQPLPTYGDGGDFNIGALLWSIFSFRGTCGRAVYWLVLLGVPFLAGTLALGLGKMAGVGADEAVRKGTIASTPVLLAIAIVVIALFVVIQWTLLATTVRRLRDRAWATSMIVVVLGGANIICAAPLLGLPDQFAWFAVPVGLWLFIECGFLGSKG